MKIGTVLGGRYRLRDRLGRGGMGEVYEAEDTTSERRVAVKVILAEQGALSDKSVRRFQREARAAMAVASEHIAQVLHAGVDEGSRAPYIIMELLSGENLYSACCRLGALPSACALRVVGQACLGLQTAHAAGIVHRDIKPENLFLARGEGGRIIVKLLDFGIAKILAPREDGKETTDLTSTGSVLGSPLYISPEQARALDTIDFRTDLWSLGALLYNALAGRAPHEDLYSLSDLLFATCTRPPTPVQEVAPWVEPEVAAIVHGALQLAPEDRFPSAAAMLAHISALLPGGLELTEDMLAPLDQVERRRRRPEIEVTTTVEQAAAEVPGSAPSRR